MFVSSCCYAARPNVMHSMSLVHNARRRLIGGWQSPFSSKPRCRPLAGHTFHEGTPSTQSQILGLFRLRWRALGPPGNQLQKASPAPRSKLEPSLIACNAAISSCQKAAQWRQALDLLHEMHARTLGLELSSDSSSCHCLP